MRSLLDTCVVSELVKPRCDPGVRGCVEAIRDEDLFLSVLTIGEITKGIQLLRASRRKDDLSRWLLDLQQSYRSRILPIDTEAAHIWGELTAAAQKRGKVVSATDGLIAATAIRHGLRLLTRNEADFSETGAMVTNPWSDT